MTMTLRGIIEGACRAIGATLKALTVLSSARNPYRLDTPAGHALGAWLKGAIDQVGGLGSRLHPRGLFYRLVGRVAKPDGSPLVNEDDTWTWLSERTIKCARYLGYLPWDALRDARNLAPEVHWREYEEPQWSLSVGRVTVLLPDTLRPEAHIYGTCLSG